MSYKIPLIYIPGLFGSLGTEILPGMGPWHFGPTHYTGKRFINQILSYGYTLDKDFFIMFYDWRKKTEDIALFTLSSLIYKAKQLSGSSQVNLICHGTGGLIARYYAQSDLYDYTIKHLILVGTPNAGFVTAFSYLNNGNIPLPCMPKPDFITLNLNLYANIFSKTTGDFSVLSEFVPSSKYGDFLIYKYKNAPYSIPRDKMTLNNPFLDQLNAHAYLLKDRQIEVTLFGGAGEATTEFLEIIPACQYDNYHDGKVINCIHSLDGDGCSLLRSVFAIEGQQYTLHCDYGELLLQSANLLPSIL